MQYITKANGASFTFELLNCDGSPVDLSTSTVKFIVKKNRTTADSLAILSSEYVNPSTNNLAFSFTATETSSLDVGDYVCALKIFRSNDMDEEVWTDDLQVVKGVFDE